MVGASRKQSLHKAAKAAPSPLSATRAKALKGRPANRGRQVVRQLTLLRAIESARRGLTIIQLHELLDEPCNVRTVYRDVEQLQAAGFPLAEEEGRWKVLQPEGATRLQAFPLQPSEVLAVLLAEDLLAPLGEGGIAHSHRDLRQRLLAQLSPGGRDWVTELRKSVRATHASPLLTAEAAVLSSIEDAYEREHCLRIVYAAPGKEPSDRTVEPHLFWLHAGRPYLVAYCKTANQFRTFAVQRIHLAEVLDESFERRTEFDASEFTERGFGVWHGELHSISLEFSAEVAHLVEERRFHASQRATPQSDGRVQLHMNAAGLPEIAAWIASFGGKVRALEPAELRDAVRNLHERGLAGCVVSGGASAPETASGTASDAVRLTSDVKASRYGVRVQETLSFVADGGGKREGDA